MGVGARSCRRNSRPQQISQRGWFMRQRRWRTEALVTAASLRIDERLLDTSESRGGGGRSRSIPCDFRDFHSMPVDSAWTGRTIELDDPDSSVATLNLQSPVCRLLLYTVLVLNWVAPCVSGLNEDSDSPFLSYLHPCSTGTSTTICLEYVNISASVITYILTCVP